jgi:hypothetical protein
MSSLHSKSLPASADPILAEPKAMTKGEREDLQRLIYQREKVLKSAAKQRSAVSDCLFADCLAQTFRYIES